MKTLRLIIVIFSIGIFARVFSQSFFADNITYVKEVETAFSQGLNEYRLGNFQQALEIFQSALTQYPNNQRITILQLMISKSYYRLDNYEKAVVTLQKLIADYPQSNYIDDCRFQLGMCYYQWERYALAAREFLWVSDYGKDKRLVDKSRNIVFKLIENNLNIEEITNMKAEMSGNISCAILTIKLAQRWDARGNKQKAISLLEEYIAANPTGEYVNISKEVLKSFQKEKKDVDLKIGIILPLSSQFSEQAQGILAGIQYAQRKFNQTSNIHITLIVKDTEGSMIRCINAAKELVKDNKVVAIIGELESEKTAGIAPIIEYNQIPLIVPIASDNGIAALSQYIFQANGDIEGRGAFLAEYAMKVLRDTTFATLAPADHYGKEMTDSFTATVDRLNGEIVAQKWYYENAQDLGRQFESIRMLGMNRMNRDSLYYAFTRELNAFQRAKFKEITLPIHSIDAIFFPIYTEDIKYVVPQYAFANIRAQILGGQYWYNLEELRDKNTIAHVENLIFESDYYYDEFDPEMRNFRTDFRKIVGRTPEAMEYYGYDAMSIILAAIKNNASNRETIRKYLDELENFRGIRGPISFKNNNRVNSEHRIISFINGRFVVIK